MSYQPVSTAAWRQASLFWADARQRGIPTASPDSLDADVILAACAAAIGQPGDQVIVATQSAEAQLLCSQELRMLLGARCDSRLAGMFRPDQ